MSQLEHLSTLAFSSLSLHPQLQSGLNALGFTHCTPIQAACLPLALNGEDLAGQAQKVWEQRLTVGAPAGSKIYHSLSGDGGEGRPFVTLHCNIHDTFVMSVPHTKISQFCSCSR